MPVSPGCPANRAKRALRLVTRTRTVNPRIIPPHTFRGSFIAGDHPAAVARFAGGNEGHRTTFFSTGRADIERIAGLVVYPIQTGVPM